jgi:hypothetical protein
MSLADPNYAAETDAQVLKDIQLLERAAREWRWLAWLWVIGGFVFSVPLLIQLAIQLSDVLNGVNGARVRPFPHALFGLIVVAMVFVPVSSLYFFIARRIGRGQRWAVGLALFIAATGAAVTLVVVLLRLIRHQMIESRTIMDLVMLLAHLNLLRVLFRSYGATLRIRELVLARWEETGSAP